MKPLFGTKGGRMEKEYKEVLTFKHKDREVVIRWAGTHFCAYAETRLEKLHYSSLDSLSPESMISAHGGITFAGTLEGHTGWFFGIDFAHSGDYLDYSSLGPAYERRPMREYERAWTLDQVKEQAIELCEEIIKYETDKKLKGLLKAQQKLQREIDAYKLKYAGRAK